ncbi:DUF6279 family lipoprotein [uncultured Sphaerotilus sp.]|uniref:DUF6279 family lipoprotein n=1 Tax=uncultured Sphaerotilus sp. TaxID=474984 RepID=UPI0030CA42D7
MLLLSVCVLLAACSTLRIGYSQADTIAYWWLDRYFDFSAAQAPQVRQTLAQWQTWHRTRQLPEDIALLEQAAQEAAVDATPVQACRWWKTVQGRQEIYLNALAEPLVETLGSLDEGQLRHLQTRLDTSNREWRDTYLRGDSDQRHRASTERIIDRADTLYGRIDSAQRRFLSERLRSSPWDPHRWLQERQRQQQELVTTLRAVALPGLDKAQRLGLLRTWVGYNVRPSDEAARQYREQLVRFQCELAADLHNRTTPEQRAHAVERLQGWARDLRSAAGSMAAAR